ncbi:MAG: hypothetical protein EA389_08535 [Ilumatobacter sp.]|nr:MAG: hypothetical protein EA389_08535 [Ilumatobacter sp.]
MTKTTRDQEMSGSRRSSTPLVLGVVVVLVIVAAVVTIALTGGDDEEPTVATVPPTSPAEDPPLDDTGDEVDNGDPTGNGDLGTVGDDDLLLTTGSGTDERLPPSLRGEARDVEIEGAWLPRFDPEAPDPAIGMRPPLLVAEDANGSVYTISPDIAGPVMLVFLAHWCPVCDDEIAHIAELERDGRLPDDMTVFGVLTAIEPGRPNFPPSRWVVDRGWPFPAVADGVDFDNEQWAAANSFGLSAYPYVVLSDDGIVVDRWSGGLGVDGLAARIDAAVG